MKYEHFNFIIQNYENSASTTYSNKYNTCTIVTSPVYIGSKFRYSNEKLCFLSMVDLTGELGSHW